MTPAHTSHLVSSEPHVSSTISYLMFITWRGGDGVSSIVLLSLWLIQNSSIRNSETGGFMILSSHSIVDEDKDGLSLCLVQAITQYISRVHPS